MNVALWGVQGSLALVFVVTGLTKILVLREKLMQRMAWAEDYGPWTIRAIGLLEVAGAAGLVAPGIFGIATILTPVAAVGLAIVMGGAATVHLRRHEAASAPILLAILALLVAAGKFAGWG